MDIINWIDKNLKEVESSSLFNNYFNVEDLIKGEDTFYLNNKREGIEIVLSKDLKISSIHLFSGDEDYKLFTGELPFKIKFSFKREDIQAIFGRPNKTGGGHRSLYIEIIPIWDKYYFETYSLHFQYSETGIDTITIASLILEKEFNYGLQ